MRTKIIKAKQQFVLGIVLGIFLDLCRKQCNENIDTDAPTKLVFIGVQTANKYVKTRIKAAYETWTKPFHGHVEIFVGERTNEGEEETIPNLPLVILQGVSDKTYPPQQKSISNAEVHV